MYSTTAAVMALVVHIVPAAASASRSILEDPRLPFDGRLTNAEVDAVRDIRHSVYINGLGKVLAFDATRRILRLGISSAEVQILMAMLGATNVSGWSHLILCNEHAASRVYNELIWLMVFNCYTHHHGCQDLGNFLDGSRIAEALFIKFAIARLPPDEANRLLADVGHPEEMDEAEFENLRTMTVFHIYTKFLSDPYQKDLAPPHGLIRGGGGVGAAAAYQ